MKRHRVITGDNILGRNLVGKNYAFRGSRRHAACKDNPDQFSVRRIKERLICENPAHVTLYIVPPEGRAQIPALVKDYCDCKGCK